MTLTYQDAIAILAEIKVKLFDIKSKNPNNVALDIAIQNADNALVALDDPTIESMNFTANFLTGLLKEYPNDLNISVGDHVTPGSLVEELRRDQQRREPLFRLNLKNNRDNIDQDERVIAAKAAIAQREGVHREAHEEHKIDSAKKYLDEEKVKKLIDEVFKAADAKNVDAILFSMFELRSYLDKKFMLLSNPLESARLDVLDGYKSIVSKHAIKDDVVIGEALKNLPSLKFDNANHLVLSVHKIATQVGIDSTSIADKLADPDIAIIRHLTHTKSIERVLPAIDALFPQAIVGQQKSDREKGKADKNRFQQKMYVYELEHSFEIYQAQLKLVPPHLDKKDVSPIIAMEFLKHIETIILTTKWKTGFFSGIKVYDTAGKLLNTVSPTMNKMLGEIQAAKQIATLDPSIWVKAFGNVAQLGLDAALNEPKILGIKTRDEQIQHFFNQFKSAHENKEKLIQEQNTSKPRVPKG